MYLGIAIEETWDYFHEIYADLCEHHSVSLFERRELQLPFFQKRTNKYLFMRRLQSLLRSNEVVFFEWASHLLSAATQYPKSCGIVTRLHRYEMYQWADQINWHAVDKIILVSEAKKREFILRFPDQTSKVVVIHEAVDPGRYQYTPKPFGGDIGILCHLTPRKRVYELILTFKELTKKRDDLHLHIAGGPHVSHGDYYNALHHIVKALELEKRVTFYGNVQDTWNWYPKIDIFISNSYSEGLQVAPMEAMASGCYCLAHCWDGAVELLPEENRYFGDGELQERILSFCEASEQEKQIQKAYMREIVCNKFNINKKKTEIRRIIEEVAANKAPSVTTSR